MPGRKEKPQEKRNYELCWVAWNSHLYQRQWEQQGLHRGGNSKTYCHHLKNIITCLKSRKSELRPSRAPLSSCRWFLHTMEWTEEAPRWAAQTTCQQLPAAGSSGSHHGADQVQPCSTNPQHHRPLTNKSVLAARGTTPPGITLQYSNPAPAQHLPSRSLLMWIPLPLILPIQTSSAWYSHRHSDSISHCTINAQGTWPCSLGRDCCWRMGRNHRVPHVGRQGFLHPAKPGHCSKPPSHSGREHCK